MYCGYLQVRGGSAPAPKTARGVLACRTWDVAIFSIPFIPRSYASVGSWTTGTVPSKSTWTAVLPDAAAACMQHPVSVSASVVGGFPPSLRSTRHRGQRVDEQCTKALKRGERMGGELWWGVDGGPFETGSHFLLTVTMASTSPGSLSAPRPSLLATLISLPPRLTHPPANRCGPPRSIAAGFEAAGQRLQLLGGRRVSVSRTLCPPSPPRPWQKYPRATPLHCP